MPAPALPITAFDKTKAAFIRKTYAVFTPAGGGGAVTIVGKVSELDTKLTVVPLKQPDIKGVLRTVRNAPSEAEEAYIISDLEDIDSVISLLGSLTEMKTGTVQFFLVDPSDVAGKVRYLSDDFPCSVMREGSIKSGSEWLKNPTLKFVSEKLGPVTWTPNAVVT